MILTKAPLRVSFYGGGTDLASHYREHGGAVLSAAINKYMYIAINKTPIDHVKLMYSEIETVQDYKNLKHDIVRNAIEYYSDKHKTGLEIASFADVPTVGTGLGSSSTFSVALIQNLMELNVRSFMPRHQKIAEWACDLEIDKCGSPIGKQDQYAAAYGGMNLFEFKPDESVIDTPTVSHYAMTENLLLFYTGRKRSANLILEKQNAEPKHDILSKMTDQAILGFRYLNSKQYDDFGMMLDEAWNLKKQLTDGISDPELDEIYKSAMSVGAYGGKILGAGGGGYFLFYVPLNKQAHVIKEMNDKGLSLQGFNFSRTGVETVYNDYNNNF
jgi:D-glycero-alpha-D-manno-heptose-7-phosphate kinase